MASGTAGQNSARRFADIGTLSKRMLAPIEGYENMPVVSLEEAVKPLVKIVPKVERNVFIVKQNCEQPEDGLTSDESASIMLYTYESIPHEHSLYVILNATLRLRTTTRSEALVSLFAARLDRTGSSSIRTSFCQSRRERGLTKTISHRQIYHLVGFLIVHLVDRSTRV